MPTSREEIEAFLNVSPPAQEKHSLHNKKKKKSHPLFVGVVLFLLFACGLAVLGAFLFGPWRSSQVDKENTIALSFQHAPSISPLEEGEYAIELKNTASYRVSDLSLILDESNEFIILQAVPAPENTHKNVWKLGELGPGETKKISMKAFFAHGSSGDKKVEARVLYHPAPLSAEFIASRSFTVAVKEKQTLFHFTAPPTIPTDTSFTITIAKPTLPSFLDEKNIELKVEYPQSFIATRTVPMAGKGSAVWGLTTLSSSEGLALTGVFQEVASKDEKLKATLVFREGEYERVIASGEVAFLVKHEEKPFLAIRLQGQETAISVSPGEKLDVILSYENITDTTFENASLSLTFEGEVVDDSSSTPVVIWDSVSLPELSEVSPGEKGEVTTSVSIKQASALSQKNTLKASGIFRGHPKEGKEGATVERFSKPFLLPVHSDSVFNAHARMDEKGVVLSWNITNSLHELEKMTVKGHLPADIEWSGKFEIPAGNLRYDPDTRTVLWTLNRIPQSVKKLDASFHLDIAKEERASAHQFPVMTDASFEALDTITRTKVSFAIPKVFSTTSTPE